MEKLAVLVRIKSSPNGYKFKHKHCTILIIISIFIPTGSNWKRFLMGFETVDITMPAKECVRFYTEDEKNTPYHPPVNHHCVNENHKSFESIVSAITSFNQTPSSTRNLFSDHVLTVCPFEIMDNTPNSLSSTPKSFELKKVTKSSSTQETINLIDNGRLLQLWNPEEKDENALKKALLQKSGENIVFGYIDGLHRSVALFRKFQTKEGTKLFGDIDFTVRLCFPTQSICKKGNGKKFLTYIKKIYITKTDNPFSFQHINQ